MKDILATLKARHFLATDAHIVALARESWATTERASALAGTYLPVLLAGVQDAMGLSPRLRAGGKVSADFDINEDLRIINTVHAHYYGLIMQALVTDDIADSNKLRQAERKRRAQERGRRGTFARTAKATLVAYVRAGGDVRMLAVTHVSKAALRAYVQEQALPPTTAQEGRESRVNRAVARVMATVERLRKEDEAAAADVAQKLILQLSDVAKCEKFTKSPRKAIETGQPLE